MHYPKTKIIFVSLFAFFMYLNCSDNNEAPPAEVRTYVDVQQSFNEFNFTPGINDVSLLNTHSFLWNFRVIMPDVDFTNNDRPLIVTLHGAAGGSPEAHKNTDCYAESGFASLDAIIISPNGGANLWHELSNQEQVLTLIDLAKTYLPVDANKIVVNGYSNGGNGSWFFAETQSELFSASIPMASYYNTTNNGVGRLIDVPLYVIHGENDELFPLVDTQSWVDASVAAGSDITLVVASGLTHNTPCDYVSHLQGAANWLINEVW